MTARLNVYTTLEAVETLLKATEGLEADIIVGDEISFGRERALAVICNGYRAPQAEQMLAAGLRARLKLDISVWCFGMALNSREAMEHRDDLLGRVMLALMADRTLGGTVGYHELTDGEADSGVLEQGHVSAGEVRILADITVEV